MSGLAEILHASGYTVTGSDLREGETVQRLRTLGIPVRIGHDPSHVGSADVVVYSAAVGRTNPELVAAEQQKLPVIPRGEMLAELMRTKHGIAVAGSHGKTTTTSLIGAVLQAGGLDPTTVVGGRLKSMGTHSRLGGGDVLVAEADESDGSFLRLLPTLVVITNVDAEHLDHYGGIEALRDAFVDFANRVPFYGATVLCIDDPGARAVWNATRGRKRTYGLSNGADVRAEQIRTEGLETCFRVRVEETLLGEARLRLPGLHNVRNALAAVTLGVEFDIPWTRIAEALAEFRGVERRFEIRADHNGVLVVDDYAHHPAEIRATLEGARQALNRRLVVAFQPHRYTRTQALLHEFAGSFEHADLLLLTEIYPAGEKKIAGIDGQKLAAAVRATGHPSVEFVSELEQLVPRLAEETRAGDAVLFMGAGDVNRYVDAFLDALGRSREGGGER
jgi:UDP-N-acetylmuramate--alanine ligase